MPILSILLFYINLPILLLEPVSFQYMYYFVCRIVNMKLTLADIYLHVKIGKFRCFYVKLGSKITSLELQVKLFE